MLTSKCTDCMELCRETGEIVRYGDGKWSREFDQEGYKNAGKTRPRWYGDGVIYTLIAYGLLEVAVHSPKSRRPYVVRVARLNAP